MSNPSSPLLGPDDPAPVGVLRADRASRFFLVCDHAGRAIPAQLGDLGLPASELERHIAWDIGALGVAQTLSELLDAPLVWQNYSRLVCDCNRPPDSPELVIPLSEATAVPANQELDDAAIAVRREALHTPYHQTIVDLLDARTNDGVRPLFVSVHSFTPSYLGQSRPWELGILSGHDRRLAEVLLELTTSRESWCVGDNEPYRIDGKDHSLPEHALGRGLPNVLFEIRQDLITAAPAQRHWGEALAVLLDAAADALAQDGIGHTAGC